MDTHLFRITAFCLQLPFLFWISKSHTLSKRKMGLWEKAVWSLHYFWKLKSLNNENNLKSKWRERKSVIITPFQKKTQGNALLKHSVKNKVFGSNYKKMLLNSHRHDFPYLFSCILSDKKTWWPEGPDWLEMFC